MPPYAFSFTTGLAAQGGGFLAIQPDSSRTAEPTPVADVSPTPFGASGLWGSGTGDPRAGSTPALLATTESVQSTEHSSSSPERIVLRRYLDRTEQAFTILVPDGWITEGGIVRVDPLAGGGPANAIAAKTDFLVASDSDATVAIYFMPDTIYFDSRGMPASQYGLFPPGSNYQGMTVWPLMAGRPIPGAGGFSRGSSRRDRRTDPRTAPAARNWRRNTRHGCRHSSSQRRSVTTVAC